MRKRGFILQSSLTILLFFITMIDAGVCLAADSCHFKQASAALSFGNLDQSSPANTTTTVTLEIKCSGQPTWFLTSNDGLYPGSAIKRMKHQTLNEFLPYTLTFSPTTGNKFVNTITGSGVILNRDYINASMGDYSDMVTLTIMP